MSLAILAAVGLTEMVLLVLGELAADGWGEVTAQTLLCPRYGIEVTCAVRRDRQGRWRGLRRCSAFLSAGAPPCEKDCLRRGA